jgi:anti-anti-sigma factor
MTTAAHRAAPDRIPLLEVAVTHGLDVHTVPRLRALLDEAFTLRPRRIVVDLEQCPFLDASAITMLVEAHRRAWLDDGILTLRAPSARLRHTLELAGVHRVFDIDPARDQDHQFRLDK